MQPDSQLVTMLLHQWKDGNEEALDQLMPLVYNELRRLAGRCLSAERPDHTLRATELVHEAYMRLIGAEIDWQDRAHFYAIAARVIRRILVDHAKSHNCQKRRGDVKRVPSDEPVVLGVEAPEIIVSLDEAARRCNCDPPRRLKESGIPPIAGAADSLRAENATNLSSMRYKPAATSYLEVPDSDTRRFTAQLGLAQPQLAELEALVQIIALSVAGGTGELETNER